MPASLSEDMESLFFGIARILKSWSLDPTKAVPIIGCSIACIFCFLCWCAWIVPFVGWLLAFPAGIIGFLGNGFAAVYMYQQSAVSFQVARMAKENEMLAKTVDNMKANNDLLHEELDRLSEFRQSIQKFSESNNQSISEVLERSNKMYRSIKNLTQDNNRTLLMRIAQDVEFMDREAGMSPLEFDRFIQRIPKPLRANLEKMPSSFQDVDKDGDASISFAEIQNFVEVLLASAGKDVDLTA